MSPPPNEDRQQILEALLALLTEALPVLPGADARNIPFLEMGANSLVLLEFQRTVERTWELTIELPQLFEELSTLDSLATHIATVRASRATAPAILPAAPVMSVPDLQAKLSGLRANIEPGGELEQLFQQQMEAASRALNDVVEQQLSFLQEMGLHAGAANDKDPTTQQPTASPQDASATTQPQRLLSPLETRARGLTSQQQQHLEELIDRYTARTQGSKQQAAQYRQPLADSRAAVGFRFTTKEMLYPIVGSRAKGARLWDIDGNEYVDITMGQGVTLFGHHPECIEEALRAQPADVAQLGPRPPEAGPAAELICEFTGMDRVTFTNTGTEAVMAALRLARGTTGRDGIVMFEGAYHGHADSVMGAPVERDGQLHTRPASPGTPQGAVDDVWVLQYGSEEALEFIAQRGAEIAAVIVEPVQSRRPDLQPVEFLRQLRRLTKDHGALLIFDEMITGFRVHPGGAQALFGVEADIATYGKVLGGGLPIGVVAGRDGVMDAIDGGEWGYGDNSYPAVNRVVFGGTFCQHPTAMVTTLATLRFLKQQGPSLQAGLNERTKRLATELNEWFVAEGIPIEVVYFGSLFRFAFSGNLELLFYHMMEQGVFIWEWRNYFLSTAHTEADVDFIIRVVKQSCERMRQGGFLGARTDSSPAITAAPADVAFPVNAAQQQLATLSQIAPAGALAYHVNALLRLSGVLQIDSLRQGLRHVVARHEALRTAVTPQQQHVLAIDAAEIDLEIVDLSTPSALTVDAWLRQHNAKPFDLNRPPLFRATLLKLDQDEWRLALSGHHVVMDGLSMNLIVRELSAAYTSAVGGVIPSADPPMQYRQYLGWQQEQSFDRQREYWLQELKGELPTLDLPADHPRPDLRSYRGGRITRPVDGQLYDSLQQLSREQGCTPFMTLFSTYALWLHRITGQDEILIGIPVAGRSLEGGDTLVGYCTHLVPVRSQLNRQQSFVDYLKATRRSMLSAYQHQDYPFARLIEDLDLRRDGRRAPLFSALFNLDVPGPAPQMTALEVNWLPQPSAHTAFDLVCNFTDADDGLVLECDYNADLFEASTMVGLVDALQTLLAATIENPHAATGALPLLDESTRQRLLFEWNETSSQYPRDRCVHDLFDACAAATPQAIAVAGHGFEVTYAELDERSTELASRLRALGVGTDRIVGIHHERTPDLIIAILATMKAGGAFLPLDPSYPRARLEFMLADADVVAVLTQRSWADTLSVADGVHVICIEEPAGDSAQMDIAQTSSPQDLAYVIYTSGSTGEPKGAMIPHRGVVNYLSWAIDRYRVREGEGTALHASIGFDATITSLLAPLLCGRRLWLAPEGASEVEVVAELLQSDTDWSLTKLTPAHLELLNATIPETELAGLTRCLVLGGEALSGTTVAPWRRSAPGTPLINEYGPTETVVGCCVHEVDETDVDHGPIAIGRPIANTHLYVLDAQLQPVPVGVPGELFIGGDGVARGYLHRPELTQTRFLESGQTGLSTDSTTVPSERLYRSGDLVRWRNDGELIYLGRLDDQIKLRGFRIELGEVEQAIRSEISVRDCSVWLDKRSAHDERLVAAVLPVAGGQLDTATLRAYLDRLLPAHMIPAEFLSVDEIPLTGNGKVDRLALAALTPTAERRRTPTRQGPQQEIAAMWQDVLGVAEVGADDNFFDLGGHSLLVLPLCERLRARFGEAAVSPVDLFRYPTVAALAGHLDSQNEQPAAPRRRKGKPRGERQKQAFQALRQARNEGV